MGMDRRTFLLSSIAAAVAGANSHAQTANVFKRAYPGFQKLVRHVAPYADVLCLAVDDHADLAANAPLTDRSVLQSMREDGFTDICFEMSYEFDERAKRLLRGDIGRTAFIGALLSARNEYVLTMPADERKRLDDRADLKSYETIADAIMAARAIGGINVHCVEPMTFQQSADMGMRLRRAAAEKDTAAYIRLVEERLSFDGKAAAHVNAVRRGKAAVWYGAWHFLFQSQAPFPLFGKPEYNIDDNLRANGARTVTVHMTNDDGLLWGIMLNGLRQAADQWKKIVGADSADFEYASKSDTVTQKNPAFPPIPSDLPLPLHSSPTLR